MDYAVADYIFHREDRVDKVLLIKHRKYGLWLPVGGHIEDGETPDDTVRREAREEVGLDLDILGGNAISTRGVERKLAVPFHVEVHPALDHEHLCWFYVCRAQDISTFRPDPREIVDSDWFAFPEIMTCPASEHVKNIAMNAFASYVMEIEPPSKVTL